MPRDLPVGNGNLLINFDIDYNIRDIYYPYVGKENHAEGCVSRTGIWIDGSFTWIDSPQWQKEMAYGSESLVTHVTAANPVIGLTLTFSDVVDFHRDIFFRRVDIANHRDYTRDVRLFFHYELRILGNEIGDTIYYHPRLRALVMYKERRYFLASGQVNGRIGIDHWTTGTKKSEDKRSAWHDAEDGELGKVPLTCGFAEGVIGLYDTAVPARGNSTIYHWLAASTRFHGIEELDALVHERGPESFIIRTRDYWRAWVNKESPDFAGLPTSISDLYRRSLLTMRVQIDNRGAIIASTDSDISEVLRDTYSYVWGRDGAFTAKALDMANYDEVSHEFFDFCANAITSEGYLLHKYTSDGCLAGQWMPWADEEGKLQLPIQEDETALVIYSLWHHYNKFRNVEFIRSHYRNLIKNAADFMVSYREPHTNLPAPSYDLWEERRGIHSFTVAAVWAGLQAAANFTEMFGEVALTKQYRQAAAEIKEAAIEYLFDKKLGRFLRSIKVDTDGVVEPDYTIDSSICGPFLFGMLQAADPLIESTMAALMDRLWCKTEVGGIARYENDRYQQVSQDIANIPGNPWFICTMWIAQYHIARAQSVDDLKPALQILIWAQRCALPSGVLAEQVHPYSCAPLSVSPLTWSHAAVVIAIHEYINKYHELQAQLHHREKDM
jgi:GH15 family glucan-1,4-alpha-glucosidase